MGHTEAKRLRSKFNKLTRSAITNFPDRGPVKRPTKRGIYVIYGPREQILHVGGTPRGRKGLSQRLSNHLYGQSSFTNKSQFLRRHGGRKLKDRYTYVRARCTYRFLIVENDRMRALLEAYAIGHLCPHHIGLHQLA